jgi:preprotein translocase subunit SecD
VTPRSAPSINDLVAGRAIIEGDFKQVDVDRMVSIFNAGRLPLPVRVIETQNIDSE